MESAVTILTHLIGSLFLDSGGRVAKASEMSGKRKKLDRDSDPAYESARLLRCQAYLCSTVVLVCLNALCERGLSIPAFFLPGRSFATCDTSCPANHHTRVIRSARGSRCDTLCPTEFS